MSTLSSAPATGAPPALEPREFLGHPTGLYVCFFTEMWERFSFYGMKALLLLYLTKYHLFTDEGGYGLLGAYGGLVYCLPVIGGLLADRLLGTRRAVVFGGVLLCLGHLGMAFEGHPARLVDGAVVRDEAALLVFYGSLALIIMGVGFLKPNISTVVGKLYAENDPRRDSGFSLFYAGINLGALLASLVCGYLGTTYGWNWGFGAAGVGMLAGLAMFLWGQKYLGGHGEAPDAAALRARNAIGLPREWGVYLGAVAGLLPIAALLWATGRGGFDIAGIEPAMALMLVVMCAVVAWFLWFVLRQCTPVERDRMLVLMALIVAALLFFSLYEQTYGSWVAFSDRLMTHDLFPALILDDPLPLAYYVVALVLMPLAFIAAVAMSRRGAERAARALFGASAVVVLAMALGMAVLQPQNASSLTFLGALFIMLLAPLFAVIWGWLDRFGANPSKPVKTALGLLFAGLSFIPLALAAGDVGASGALASVWWLVLAYFVLEIGEMCLSPVGLSAVTQLSVPRVASLMMGTWFLATAFSEALAAEFGKLAALDAFDAGSNASVVDAAAKYGDLFWLMAGIGLGCGVLALLLAPLLRRRMHGVA